MRRLVMMVLSAAALLALSAAPALAGPPVEGTPVSDGPAPHTHHVETASGCVDIDAVAFFAVDTGLHRGASASGANGPSHGSCS